MAKITFKAKKDIVTTITGEVAKFKKGDKPYTVEVKEPEIALARLKRRPDAVEIIENKEESKKEPKKDEKPSTDKGE